VENRQQGWVVYGIKGGAEIKKNKGYYKVNDVTTR